MILTIGASLVCLLVCLPMFMYCKQSSRIHLAAMYKCAGTLCALVPALIAAIRLDPRCWICVSALALCLAGDYLLEFSFLRGAGLFLSGHVCYIAFLANRFPLSVVHLICLCVLIGAAAYVLYRNRNVIGKRMPVMIVYGMVLCAMTAFSVGSLSAGGVQSVMIACGGALFFISDFILLFRLLYTAGRGVSWIIMITYYCAQLLIGLSCLYI